MSVTENRIFQLIIYSRACLSDALLGKSSQAGQKTSKPGLSFNRTNTVKLMDWHGCNCFDKSKNKKIKATWTCFPLERIIHKYQQSKENTMEYRKYHHTGYLLIIDTICWNRVSWENENISNVNFLLYFSAQVFVLAVENTNIQDFLGRYCTTLQQVHIASWQLT